ncbi:hypothetical protein D358_00001 [Enterococcus faecalis RP2S-4]|uniref:Uncharacterized protein n=1 Tax=Enterococcus faecalis RP2S-4 TaxID=1244145 RepID=A0ABC9TNY1_ENTFL|nr:hypothetical protein D358_00001 [Enterococcus faecalis RP2S-4]
MLMLNVKKAEYIIEKNGEISLAKLLEDLSVADSNNNKLRLISLIQHNSNIERTYKKSSEGRVITFFIIKNSNF